MAIILTCPCGFVVEASSLHRGLSARCARCGRLLPVPPDESGVSSPVTAEEAASCACCGVPIACARETVCCRHCRAPYHLDCWREQGGCVSPACEVGLRGNRPVIPSVSPAAVACPACGEPIPQKAARCRFCGTHLHDRKPARRLRAVKPVRTSHAAGLSVILGVLTLLCLPFLETSSWRWPLGLVPTAGAAIGTWALWDINRAAGEKSGGWMAGIGVALCAIDLLAWLLRVTF